MKVLIIGGNEAGTKVAAKLKREDCSIEVTIMTKESEISYASCGIPYYVGDVIDDLSKLIINTPKAFSELTGVNVVTEVEVIKVNTEEKIVTAMENSTGSEQLYSYDKLVIACETTSITPAVDGIDKEGVFFTGSLRDAKKLKTMIQDGSVKRAVVVGAGYSGLEMAANLHAKGVKVSMIEASSHILKDAYDSEIAEYIENKMALSGVMVLTGVVLEGVSGNENIEKVLTNKRPIKADIVLLATGITANTKFLIGSGIEMKDGIILTDGEMKTNKMDVYAVGDCTYVSNGLTKESIWAPMGSTATILGRILAKNMLSEKKQSQSVLETSIAKIPGNLTIGRTGITEKKAKALGYEVETVVIATEDKSQFYPDSKMLVMKLLADKLSRKVLGIQVVGGGAVDKIIDIAVMGISLEVSLNQLENLDFAYAPPFSTVIHPFSTAINILQNKLDGTFKTMTPTQFKNTDLTQWRIVDTSRQPAIPGADYLHINEITETFDQYPKDEKILLVCNRGRRAYLAQNLLKQLGYSNVYVLEGGSIVSEVSIL